MHFQQFVWTCQKLPLNRHFCWHLLKRKSRQKCRFGGQFFESSNKLLKRHVLSQNELTNKSKQNWHQKCPKLTLTTTFSQKATFRPSLKKVIFADFSMLHIRRVLSVWAENCVRALTCPKELPNKFSAQTDNTRKTWTGLNLAILAFSGATLQILTKTKTGKKNAFWALLSANFA